MRAWLQTSLHKKRHTANSKAIISIHYLFIEYVVSHSFVHYICANVHAYTLQKNWIFPQKPYSTRSGTARRISVNVRRHSCFFANNMQHHIVQPKNVYLQNSFMSLYTCTMRLKYISICTSITGHWYICPEALRNTDSLTISGALVALTLFFFYKNITPSKLKEKKEAWNI